MKKIAFEINYNEDSYSKIFNNLNNRKIFLYPNINIIEKDNNFSPIIKSFTFSEKKKSLYINYMKIVYNNYFLRKKKYYNN